MVLIENRREWSGAGEFSKANQCSFVKLESKPVEKDGLMLKSVILFALVTTTPVLLNAAARAQVSIRDLQRNPGLSIAGEIRSIVGNEFILDDGTGQMIVDAGPRWYHQIDLSAGERVTVTGEYDHEEFDAYTITRQNGEVIQIRQAGGPPPWAGVVGVGTVRYCWPN